MATDASPATLAWFAALYRPSDLIELRALRQGAPPKVEWITAADADSKGVAGLLARWRKDQRNVYAGVNPRKSASEKGTAANVALARCVFVDLDGWTKDAALGLWAKLGVPKHSLAVSSGHGYHLFWTQAEPITDLALWSRYQRALIALCDADPCIHDPPRIMRIPGTCNWKSDPPVECELVESGEVAPPVVGWLTPATDTPAREPAATASGGGGEWRKTVSRATLVFLTTGASEGARNQALFAAACDAAANGCGFAEAIDVLGARAGACGLSPEEVESTIRSAFGKPRTPARPSTTPQDASGPVAYSAWEPGKATPDAGEKPPPEAKERDRKRPVLSNVGLARVLDAEGKPKTEAVYKPIAQFATEIGEASGGWPRRASGNLFALQTDHLIGPDGLPAPGVVWDLENSDSLSAWMHTVADVRWASAKQTPKNADGAVLSAAGKRELWEYLSATAKPHYRTISTLPHEPPMPGVFYLPCQLPPATGEHLAELIARYNPASEEDRELLFAATVTPGWGGNPGRRPPFVLCSQYGRGTGKTATVQAIGEMLWGGIITIKKGESWEKVVGRLLAIDGLATRVAMLDNVKGRAGGEEIEGLITARTIDGWRPHVGQASRPNDLTYFFTSNSPRLSPDLAMRAVVIEIGKQRHESSFIEWASRFIAEHRAQLIADCLAVLAGPVKSTIRSENLDRWQDWQQEVLCKVSTRADALASLIKERRAQVDDDQEDAERVAEAIARHLRKRGVEPNAAGIRLTRNELHEVLRDAKITPEGWSAKRTTNWVASMSGQPGPLAGLENQRRRDEGERVRFWIWRTSDRPGESDLGDLPV